MASFYAELQVSGKSYPVRHCNYGVHQPTNQRGQVSAKVRYESVKLVLDVPDDEVLLSWAADPHKQFAATIVFADAAGGSAIETLQLPAAYCITYAESFQQGDSTSGAYVCHLTLIDPTGWTIQAGGPTNAFITSTPGEHSFHRTTIHNTVKAIAIMPAETISRQKDVVAMHFSKFENDPARDYYGSGRESHPVEWQETLDYLKAEGVEIRYRKNTLAYAPSNNAKPGQLILDEDASYSALRHEYQHYLDDKANGFPGGRVYYDPTNGIRKQMETNAYNVEIELAVKQGNTKLAADLEKLKRQEHERIDNSI